jgi:hypothetical protein
MSNDKVAATLHGSQCEACQGTDGPFTPDVEGGVICAACADDTPDAIEPLSLADLCDLIKETAETLDTLVDHAHAARRAAVGEEDGPLDQVATLRDIADRLASAWAACVGAHRAAQALAAVKP